MAEQYKGKRSIVVYPAYINSKINTTHGRKISLAAAVENPTLHEVGVAVDLLRLPMELEINKSYCKDWMNPGRFRVTIKDEKDALISGIKNSMHLSRAPIADRNC